MSSLEHEVSSVGACGDMCMTCVANELSCMTCVAILVKLKKK